MTGSNISKIAASYQSNGFSVGNADSGKKLEEAQAVFATMLGQMNLDVNQQDVSGQMDMSMSDSARPVGVADEVTDAADRTQDFASGKDSSGIKKAEDTGAAVKEKAETLVDETDEAIREVVEEELSVTAEELDAVLEELGLNPVDLLNPANLAQVVAELTGAGGTDSLLMSEEFVNVMQAMNAITTELAMELQVTPEELQQILSEVTEQSVLPGQPEVSEEQMLQQFDDIAAATTEQPETDGQVADDVIQLPKTEQAINTEDVSESSETDETVGMQKISVKQQATGEDSAGTGEAGQETTDRHNESAQMESRNADGPMFESNVSQTVNRAQMAETGVTPVTTSVETVNVTDILQQIAEYVKVSVTQNTSSLEMQLNPENLGKLYLQLTATKEGNITAQLAAQSEAVKEALEIQLVELRQTLNQQGIKVDAIEVTVATHEFERNLEQNAQSENQQGQQEEKKQGRRNLNLNQLDELSGLMTEEEMLAAKIMHENGNSMDVTA